MNCPPEIAAILLDVLYYGILRVRARSDEGERVFLEADHLHNLPQLIRDFSPARLHYYWNVERTCYMARTTPQEQAPFQELWRVLEPYVEATVDATASAEALAGSFSG